jgi:hypothetical protein
MKQFAIISMAITVIVLVCGLLFTYSTHQLLPSNPHIECEQGIKDGLMYHDDTAYQNIQNMTNYDPQSYEAGYSIGYCRYKYANA